MLPILKMYADRNAELDKQLAELQDVNNNQHQIANQKALDNIASGGHAQYREQLNAFANGRIYGQDTKPAQKALTANTSDQIKAGLLGLVDGAAFGLFWDKLPKAVGAGDFYEKPSTLRARNTGKFVGGVIPISKLVGGILKGGWKLASIGNKVRAVDEIADATQMYNKAKEMYTGADTYVDFKNAQKVYEKALKSKNLSKLWKAEKAMNDAKDLLDAPLGVHFNLSEAESILAKAKAGRSKKAISAATKAVEEAQALVNQHNSARQDFETAYDLLTTAKKPRPITLAQGLSAAKKAVTMPARNYINAAVRLPGLVKTAREGIGYGPEPKAPYLNKNIDAYINQYNKYLELNAQLNNQ